MVQINQYGCSCLLLHNHHVAAILHLQPCAHRLRQSPPPPYSSDTLPLFGFIPLILPFWLHLRAHRASHRAPSLNFPLYSLPWLLFMFAKLYTASILSTLTLYSTMYKRLFFCRFSIDLFSPSYQL
ncbi:hypothetical protein FB45DRAFT_488288 [Roridomyces roridus]|uniref:Uncharacterized protein n=1 Tax=Roridomyces roridus TaxID=1738132 RepID=A0AAD7AZD6_9AGAR|nr:hypothetical protein FB45DRAFT_488288 [Roridomyces roridus]